MTRRHMMVFREVYRCQSITRAAEALHLTQPSVSRAVQELEQAYGVTLFDRMNRRLYPTDAAHELYAWALRITDAYDAMEKTMLHRDAQGEIRIGATLSIGAHELPQLVKRLQEELPEMTVRVTVLSGELLREMLLENTLDIALMEGVSASDALVYREYDTDALCLIVPPEHPLAMRDAVTLAEAAASPLLLRNTGSVCRAQVDHLLAAHGIVVKPLWESGSTAALVNAVAEGLGVSILPCKLVHDAVMAGSVKQVDVSDADFTRPVSLVWHKGKYLNTSMQRLIALCTKEEE